MSEICKRSAREMMVGLQQKEFSSYELVQAHIEQIENVNPTINAVTHKRYEAALTEAKQADLLRASRGGDISPFLGIPITVKEMFDVEGLPTTGGVLKHANRVAERDAYVVQKVREAGLIILAKTNASTLTMAHETDNLLFGRTNHPFDGSRTPGGSSGGEASLISSYASPWGIGSDLGGSIRLPSHFCGISGIRPTYDRIPTEGEYPHIEHQAHMNSLGPLARHVGDLKLLYSLLSGHSIEELDTNEIPLFWLHEMPGANLDHEVSDLLLRVIGELQGQRQKPIQQIKGEGFKGISSLWQAIILQDRGTAIIDEIQEGDSFPFYKEYIKSLFGKSRYHRWILSVLLGGKLFAPNAKKVEVLAGEVERVRNYFQQLVKNTGILLTPVFPVAAPKHGYIVNRVYANRGASILPYLVFVNVMGYPAATVPVARTKSGLPVGIQIVGGYHEEAKVLSIAERIEQIVGVWNR